MELTSPTGQILYKDTKKQYDSFTWTTANKGEYTFCFSNEFSTFTHKTVYFDFQVGDEEPVVPSGAQHATALTMVNKNLQHLQCLKETIPCIVFQQPLELFYTMNLKI